MSGGAPRQRPVLSAPPISTTSSSSLPSEVSTPGGGSTGQPRARPGGLFAMLAKPAASQSSSAQNDETTKNTSNLSLTDSSTRVEKRQDSSGQLQHPSSSTSSPQHLSIFTPADLPNKRLVEEAVGEEYVSPQVVLTTPLTENESELLTPNVQRQKTPVEHV